MLQPQCQDLGDFLLGISSSVQRVPSPSHSSTEEARELPKNLFWKEISNERRWPLYGQAVSSTVGATRPLRNLFIAQTGSVESRGTSSSTQWRGSQHCGSTSLPEGKPTCLTSSPSKQGVVLRELKQLARGDLPSLQHAWKKSLRYTLSSKRCFPARFLADKGNPVRVLTANSSCWAGEMEAKNMLCRDSGIVYRGMTKPPDFINLKWDAGLLNWSVLSPLADTCLS